MILFFYFFIFLFGLIAGSFLNVVVFRLESGEQMISGRSHCQHCKHILAWYDLVPIFSFIALFGRCRYCKKKLSIQYPLVEFAMAILFILIFSFQFFPSSGILFWQNTEFPIFDAYFLMSFFYYLFIASALIVIFVYDLKHYIIPDMVIYPAIFISIIYDILHIIFNLNIRSLDFENLMVIFGPFIAAFVAGLFFLSIVIITKGKGMGGGDIKLVFLMGLIVGWPKILISLFIAFTLGAVCGIILMYFKKKTFKSEIPFGPFLVLGAFIALFWGNEIIKWYGRYLF